MRSRLGKGRAADGKGDLLRGAMLSSHSSRPHEEPFRATDLPGRPVAIPPLRLSILHLS